MKCNICNGCNEMINIWGNQSYEYSLIPCSCQGGPEFIGDHKHGFQKKSELDSYQKWLSSDSDEMMYEPDYWFPNTEGYGDPSEEEYDDKEDRDERLSLAIRRIIDNDETELLIEEVEKLPQLEEKDISFDEYSMVNSSNDTLVEYYRFPTRARVSVFYKTGTKERDIIAVCEKYL